MRDPDAVFADPRLAVLYDVFDDDRSDLDAYATIAEEVAATTVVDIGCGTGSLAVRLAALGLCVVAVDPAAASLEVARAKPYADRVTWVHGDATALAGRGLDADLAVMTGNVAQVLVSDVDWQLSWTPCAVVFARAAGSRSSPGGQRSGTGRRGTSRRRAWLFPAAVAPSSRGR